MQLKLATAATPIIAIATIRSSVFNDCYSFASMCCDARIRCQAENRFDQFCLTSLLTFDASEHFGRSIRLTNNNTQVSPFQLFAHLCAQMGKWKLRWAAGFFAVIVKR